MKHYLITVQVGNGHTETWHWMDKNVFNVAIRVHHWHNHYATVMGGAYIAIESMTILQIPDPE